MATKAEFLGRIRAEMARTPGLFTVSAAPRPARPGERLALLRRELAERWPATLERFARELERVGGVFHRVASAGEVAGVVADLARAGAMERVVAWAPGALGLDLAGPLAARGLSAVAMPEGDVAVSERTRLREVAAVADLGVTGVDLAIAETGTLVVVSGAGRPRSTSLLPPCHVAVLDREALVESLEQAGLVLEAWHDGEAGPAGGASINFITGPSRTADIELTLTRGVHGPKELHAVFVEQGLARPRHG